MCSTLVLYSGHSCCFPLKNKHGCILSLSATQLTSITFTAREISLSSQGIGYISVFHCVKNIFIKALVMAEFVIYIILTYSMLQSLKHKSKYLFLGRIYLTLAFLSLCGSARLCKWKDVSSSSFFPNLLNMLTFHNLFN